MESCISAVRRVLLEKILSQAFYAQVNKALSKLVAYNLRVPARGITMRDLDLDLQAMALPLEDCIGNVVEMQSSQAQKRVA